MIWIIQNQQRVPAGQYHTILQELDRPFKTIQLHQGIGLPVLTADDSVLVLGGTMSFNDDKIYPWLTNLKQFMLKATDADTPLLGICLGAQLLADVLGGSVTRNQHQERGICRVHLTEEGRNDPLMAEIPTTFPVMQWHNDSFDLPPQATLLASSSTCPVQAFRYRNAYGFQFHPEVNQPVIRNWNDTLDPPGHYHQEFAVARPDWQPVWDRLLINFLAVVQ